MCLTGLRIVQAECHSRSGTERFCFFLLSVRVSDLDFGLGDYLAGKLVSRVREKFSPETHPHLLDLFFVNFLYVSLTLQVDCLSLL